MSEAMLVPVGVSARHIHLSQEHVEVLFGPGHQLTVFRDLSQPGQFACEEVVEVVGPKRSLARVRVLGPARGKTQVELALTDAFAIGVKAPIRDSGDHHDTPGVILRGPAGEVTLEAGVIVAARHIHMHTSDGAKWGIKDGDRVRVKTTGERALLFENVLCRVRDDFALDMHIDTDEANAAGLGNGAQVEIMREG